VGPDGKGAREAGLPDPRQAASRARQPYASAGYRKNWKDLEAGFAAELRHWTHDVGFRAAKVKTGYDPVTDYRVVSAVRKAIGDEIRLGIDSGTPGAYDDGTAVSLGRRLEELNLEFWEEPINKYWKDTRGSNARCASRSLPARPFPSTGWWRATSRSTPSISCSPISANPASPPAGASLMPPG
jgi:hypothetical protein